MKNLRFYIICIAIIAGLLMFGDIDGAKANRALYGVYDTSAEIEVLPRSCADELAKGWTVKQADSEEILKMYYAKSSDSDMEEYYNKNGLIGLTLESEHTVWVSTTDREAKFALAHEIGHVCDINNSVNGIKPSETEEFKYIYELEAYGYGELSPTEFFAEVYAKLTSPYAVKEETPLADEYVMRYIY